MRTSEQIYNRIRWDQRFDPARFVVGIDLHRAEPKRAPLTGFVPGGDIPWHRVLFFEAEGVIVWDRRDGTDRLDSAGVGLVRTPRVLHPPFFEARRAFRFDAESFRAATPSEEATAQVPRPLRVVTWNTLWDRYDEGELHTATRHPRLLRELEALDADIIALQEAEAPLVALLLGAGWVRASYAATDDERATEAEEHGLFVLTRLPVREVGTHAFGPHKGVVAVVVDTADGPLAIVDVHLTSDHTQGGDARRAAEIAALRGGLEAVECDILLVGDFNDGSEALGASIGMRDLWTELRGEHDTTPTFDPPNNPLAAICSLTGLARRLDRIFYRGKKLAPRAIDLVGTSASAEDGLFVSDHYGVVADLDPIAIERPTTLAGMEPTSRTALAWIPDTGALPQIQRIREAHDPQFDRWPPHVNVLFGFVAECHLEIASDAITGAVTAVPPFATVLEGVESFEHSITSTYWLNANASATKEWERLHSALRRSFPRCAGRAEGFTPHLTLARGDESRFETLASGWAKEVGRTEARVEELVVLSRRGDEPMRPRAVFSLGTRSGVRWVEEIDERGAERSSPPRAELQRATSIAARIASALPGAAVHVTGSHRLGCAIAGADLDMVAALPSDFPADRVEAALREALPELGSLRNVVGARVPGVELRAGGLDIDLTLVECGAIDPAEAVMRRAEIGAHAAMALSAVSDADEILAAVAHAREPFAKLARTVKAWARLNGLDAAPFGGLPGLAWTVLAARTILDGGEDVRQFFATWAAWDFRVPVTLTGREGPPSPSPLCIETPTPPIRSMTEAVGPSAAATLAEELFAAWERLERDDRGSALFVRPALHRRHAAWAVVSVRAQNADARAVAEGWLRGKVRALIGILERAEIQGVRAWPRPFSATPHEARYAIGLGRRPPDAATLRELTAPWCAALSGVTIEWADNGSVPTLG